MDYLFVYSKDNCPWCDRAKELIKSHGRKYIEIDIGKNPQWMPKEFRTVPQVWDGSVHIGGYEDLETHLELIRYLRKSA